jgi:hypothetical protein
MMGIVAVAAFAAIAAWIPPLPMMAATRWRQLGGQCGHSIELMLPPPVKDCEVVAFHIAGLGKALAKPAQAVRHRVGRALASRKPMTGIVDCCARAVSGHAAAAPPSAAKNFRRLMWLAM